MKTSKLLRVIPSIFLLALLTAPLRATDATYGNLTVTGTGIFQGASTMFGDWTEGGDNAGVTLNFTDGSTTAINFIGSGTSAVWQWWNNDGAQNLPVLKLDQNNQLIVYVTGTSGVAGITLNPSGGSTFAGSVTINGTNSTLPNQVLVGGSSVLTESLGDGRYLLLSATSNFVSNSNFSVGTGTASGTYSAAIGNGVLASGSISMASGLNTLASGNYAAAFGKNTTAQGYEQFVVGQYNLVQGGSTASTGTNPLFVVGNGTDSSHLSDAMVVQQNGYVGIGVSAPTQQLDISGNLQIPATTGSGGVIYQNGTTLIHSSGSFNFFAGKAAGNLTLTGLQNTGNGTSALASLTSGNFNTALGSTALYRVTTGLSNTGVGNGSLAQVTTDWGNTAVGDATFYLSVGSYNVLIGKDAGRELTGSGSATNSIYIGAEAGNGGTGDLTNAIAIGYSAQVTASNSFILGGTGAYAVKVGIGKTAAAYQLDVVGDVNFTGNFYHNGVLASGTGAAGSFASLSLGGGTVTSGTGILAVGTGTASGYDSSAIGNGVLASGNNTVAFGDSTTAQGYDQFVIGRYNVVQGSGTSWVGTDDLFVVGNGISSGTTSNAFVISKNGDTTVNGGLMVTGTSGSLNKVLNGGFIVTGTSVPVVVGSGTVNTFVSTGTNNLMLIPQQGDLSMGEFTAGATPQ